MKKATSDETGETVTTTVAFDRGTYRRLRHLAVDRDSNVRDIIREAVADYLKRQSGRERS